MENNTKLMDQPAIEQPRRIPALNN